MTRCEMYWIRSSYILCIPIMFVLHNHKDSEGVRRRLLKLKFHRNHILPWRRATMLWCCLLAWCWGLVNYSHLHALEKQIASIIKHTPSPDRLRFPMPPAHLHLHIIIYVSQQHCVYLVRRSAILRSMYFRWLPGAFIHFLHRFTIADSDDAGLPRICLKNSLK